MAEEVQGQGNTPPAQLPDNINEYEAVGILTKAIDAEDKKADEAPRDDKGRFAPKQEEATAEEAKTEEAPVEEEPAAEPEETPQPRKLKLKYRDQEMEVDEAEAVQLAQKGYDYHKNIQELQKERAELQSKTKAEVEAKERDYLTKLGTYRRAVEKVAGVEQIDLNKLALEDPARAQLEFFKQLQFQQTLAAIDNEIQQATQQKEAKAKEEHRAQARSAVERLKERIPGWSDEVYGKILKTGVDHYGFEQQEVNAIVDPRAIEVLNDARQWREYLAAKPKASEKKVPPVAPKVQKPGSGEKGRSDDKIGKSMAKLKETGSREAAQEHVLALIEAGRL